MNEEENNRSSDVEAPFVLSEEELERWELEDQATEVGFMSPREYAKLRNVTPQLVYYYIRTKKIRKRTCVCGRSVIEVVEADACLQKKESTSSGDVAPIARQYTDD